MMSSITSIVLVLFAAIIVLVSLLVVRFRIRNSIEEGMTNIGALKAVGYTGTQLLHATLLQFALIAVVGTLGGIGLSYAVLPFVSQVLESQTALLWRQGFDPLCSALTLVFILLAVLAVTWLSARRIRTLQALVALRQGLATHSFKHNYLPLDTSKGALAWLLAIKSTLQSKGQMITIAIIVATVTFAAAAGVSIYDNLALHPDAFGRLLSGEMPDAALFVDTPDNAEKIRESIEDDERVRKVFSYQNFLVMIEDINVNAIAVEDPSLLEGGLLYEGRYPEHDNEVAISGILFGQTGKAIGDTIEVAQGARTDRYLVVGLIQTVNNNGLACMLTPSGVCRIQPDFRFREIYVYMQDSTQTAEFLELVSQRFGADLNSTVNLSELMDAQLGVYGDIFQVVAIAVVAVTALVVFLVLYLMLKTVILRRRRELGIHKALGFTTWQLMNQFALQFIPVITLGIAVGGIAGIFGFNPIFVALTRGMGIMTASMPAPLGLTTIMCVALVVLAYALALLIAWRIRKVSAYALVSE
jgi:putative ABC transport system permease protein